MKNYLADISLGPLRGFGTLGLEKDNPNSGISIFVKFLSSIIGLLTIIAGIWFTIQIVIGAISIITSAGDKNNLENARKKITESVIGLVIVISAIFLIDLVGSIFGLDVLGIQDLFNRILI